MASVTSVQRNMETRFTIELIGDNLDNNHMSKIIKWAVNDFKNKYPLLFTRDYAGGRRPDYEWEELLAFEIYSVYSNKRTLRKRVEWISDNSESVNYILNNKSPGKTTLNNFKLENPLLIIEFFQYTIDLGIDLGLVGGEILVADSTKIKAFANEFKTLSIGQLDYLLNLIYDLSFDTSKNSKWSLLRKFFFTDKLPKKLGDLVKEIDKNLNQHGINLLKTALQSQENRDWVIGWLDELVDNYDGKKRVNLTDPESRKMKMKDGTSRYAYTLQTVRDVKTGFTVSQRITQEKNDKKTLIPIIDDVISNLGKTPRYILIDNGYWDIESLEYSYLRNIIPIIPDLNQSKRRNGTNISNPYAKHNMLFDPVGEYYQCPYDKIENRGIHKIRGENKRVFKSTKCPECPFHNKCAGNSKYRVFHESTHPLILELRKNFIASVELSIYQYRGIYSEGGFGTLKNARQYPDLKRRGKQKADIDLKIESTVDNLIKIRDHLKATLITIP